MTPSSSETAARDITRLFSRTSSSSSRRSSSILPLRLGPCAGEELGEVEADAPGRHIFLAHVAAADAQDLHDIAPLLVRNRSGVALPEQLTEHGVLRALHEELLPGSGGDAFAPGELCFVERRPAQAEDAIFVTNGR